MKKLSVLIAIMALIDFGSLALADPGNTWDTKINNPSRFTILSQFGNLAVLDNETGRVWQRRPSTDTFDWNGAQSRCNRLIVGNRQGWRLPTIQELASLVDPSRSNPALPRNHPFINVQLQSFYWSATTNASSTNRAWAVDFESGQPPFEDPKGSTNFAWCVRGGQGVDLQ
jgi:Protein of unknown function (DUF1566)